MTFLLNPRFQTPADKGQIRGKFQNKGRQIKGKILKNKGQIAVQTSSTETYKNSQRKLHLEVVAFANR